MYYMYMYKFTGGAYIHGRLWFKFLLKCTVHVSLNNGVGVDPIYMESNSYVSRGEPVTVGITNLR